MSKKETSASCSAEDLAPRAKFELATLRLTPGLRNSKCLIRLTYDRTTLNPAPQLGNFGQPKGHKMFLTIAVTGRPPSGGTENSKDSDSIFLYSIGKNVECADDHKLSSVGTRSEADLRRCS